MGNFKKIAKSISVNSQKIVYYFLMNTQERQQAQKSHSELLSLMVY